jgi:hypothetical protein
VSSSGSSCIASRTIGVHLHGQMLNLIMQKRHSMKNL